MSMVIGGGKKTTFKNMEEVIKWVNKIRPKMTELAEIKFEKKMASSILGAITHMYSEKKVPKNFRLVFSKRYYEADIKPGYSLGFQAEGEIYSAAKYDVVAMERNPDIDFRSELVVIPYKGEFYSIWYGEDRNFEALVDEQPEMLEFWYDGRTDGPEDMEYEEYSARGDVWNEIFEKYTQPNEVGVTIDLLTRIPMRYSVENVAKYMAERRTLIVEEIAKYDDPAVYNEWLKNPENAELDRESKDSNSMKAFFEFRKWIKADGKDLVDEHIKKHDKTFPSADKFNDYIEMKVSDLFKEITGEEYDA